MFGHWMIYVGARLALCLVQAMRIETCQTLSRWLAHLAYDVLRLRRPVIDDNLRHAFPDQSPAQIRRVALGMWEHVILMVCELAHVPRKLHDTNWRDYVRMSDADMQLLLKHLLSPRPVVIVSGHFGNFEVGGIVAGLLGFPTFTVARPLDNPYLHRFVTRFREATGQFMLPKRGSAAQLDAILQAGGTMVLLGDQAAGPKGCWVEFFGRPASCHKAVALFSLVNLRAPVAGLQPEGTSDAIRHRGFRGIRSAAGSKRWRPRVDPVVQQAFGAYDSDGARSVLVAAQSLEEQAGPGVENGGPETRYRPRPVRRWSAQADPGGVRAATVSVLVGRCLRSATTGGGDGRRPRLRRPALTPMTRAMRRPDFDRGR